MAIDQLDANATRYFSTPDDADWTFPTGSDWFFYIQTRVDNNNGTLFQYLFSTGGAFTTDSTNLFLVEASNGTDPGAWVFIGSSAGNVLNSQSLATNSPGADGKDRIIGIQRVSGVLEMWFIENGQTAVKLGQITESLSRNGGAPNIGRRTDGNSVRYYETKYGDVVKGSTSLTTDQWTLLGQGVSPFDVAGAANVDIWFPFREVGTTVNDLVAGKVATKQGTGQLTAEHFPYIQANIMFTPTAAAPVGGRIMSSLANGGGLAGLGGIAGPGGGLAG